jgi:hypothetical protein
MMEEEEEEEDGEEATAWTLLLNPIMGQTDAHVLHIIVRMDWACAFLSLWMLAIFEVEVRV